MWSSLHLFHLIFRAAFWSLYSVQFSIVAQSCLTLCDPMNRSTPGLPVHHQLPEFTQTQRPSSQWCHPAISSSVVPFSSCPQSLPASESFPVSQLFAWGGQSTGVSASASFPPKKSRSLYYRSPIQDGKIETQSLVATKCHVPRKVARPRPVPGMPGSKDNHLLVRFSPISDCNVNQVI